MLKTPPTVSSEKFAAPSTPITPAKQISLPVSPASLPPRNLSCYDTSASTRTKSVTGTPSSATLSINTVFESPLYTYDNDPELVISPVSLPSLLSPFNGKSQSSWEQMLPASSVFSDTEIRTNIEDCIIDEKFKQDLKISGALGTGAFSTVHSVFSHDHEFAIKIPKNLRSSKQILKEMFNFKIISEYLTLHNINTSDIPILNAYGLIFLNKSEYSKIRYGETLPCSISTKLSSNLSDVIKSKSSTGGDLHIGAELWWKLAKQLCIALIILKDCSMVHMDLKTSNILFDSNSNDFKVGDFTSAGLTTDMVEQYYKMAKDSTYFDVTLQYCAPEMIQSPPAIPSFQTDLYAVGLILLAAAIGEEPYTGYLKSRNFSHPIIALNDCIRKNAILDVVPLEKRAILESNKDAYDLIRMILIDRSPLETIVAFMNT